MADTINVLDLTEVTEMQDTDTLLLIRNDNGTQTAYRVDAGNFKGADGKTGQLSGVTVVRNRLVATLDE